MIASAFIFCINNLNYTEPQSNLLTIHICLSTKIDPRWTNIFQKEATSQFQTVQNLTRAISILNSMK